MLDAFLAATVAMATPILLAALGELIVERSGVINIGIEGSMLVGAFVGLATAYFSGNLLVGILAAMIAAVMLNALLASLVVNFAANQVVAGTALNILALGFTGVAYRRLFGVTGRAIIILTLRPPFGAVSRARLPIVGPLLLEQNSIVYLTCGLVPIVGVILTRTRWGLHLRAAGEHPEAADALGLRVSRLRWQALILAGALTGLAGAYLTLGYTGTFVEGISGGRGFVALAVVIVGRWKAWGVAAASILFGAATALQYSLQATGATFPYQLFLALPYLLTLAVLGIVGGQAEAPGALGESYVRE